MPEPMLALRDLALRYGSVEAVRGLDLFVDEGEIVGLIGANGAGKTTTLHAVMGVVPVASGDIRFEDRSLVGMAPEAVARLGVGLVPEGRRIFSDFTVAENLRLGALSRTDRSKVDEDLRWIHSLFPIVGEFADRTAGQLSGGQQQQLAIARALVSQPKLLLLDEPSLGLAPTIVDELFVALGRIRDEGVTILIVEQRAEQTAEFADRTVVMRTGEVALEIGPEDSVDSELLATAYFGS